MSNLRLDNVTKIYNDLHAVDGVNLEINEGEFFVLFGPSGAGKTTTLRLVSGLEDPSSGEIRIGGRSILNVVPEERNVAYAFENYALYPHMSVYENIAYPLKAPVRRWDQTKIDKRVDHIVQMLRIDHLLERLPHQLSGGQKQRVALARCMVREADVYLLDEPLSHVDAKIRHEMRREFHSLKSTLLSTTLYVTHDYMEAISLGERIAIIKEGRILQVGAPREIWYHPLTKEIASIISAPRINLLDGEIMRTNGQSESELELVLSNGIRIPVPLEMKSVLNTRNRITIGVRPHLINIFDNSTDLSVSFKTTVRVVELLGADLLMTTESKGLKLRVVEDSQKSFIPGEEIMVGWDLADVFWFDTDTGANIAPRGSDEQRI